MMQAPIVTAQSDDFINIAALDRISWTREGDNFIPDGEHIWRVWCEYATVLLARSQQALPASDCVAGALVFFPTTTHHNFLHKIMVHSECRGLGLGSQLMLAAIDASKAPLLLTVDPDNTAAVSLYEKFGFSIHRRVDGYYRPHEDRLLMIHPCE